MFSERTAAAPYRSARNDTCSKLIRELEAAGVTPHIRMWEGRACAHGQGLSLDVRGISSTDSYRLLDALVDDRAASVTAVFPRPCNDAAALFREFCKQLGAVLHDHALSARMLGVAVDASCLDPERAWQIRRGLLGAGPLYFLVDGDLTQRSWLLLWHMRNIPGMSIVLPAQLSSPCPLLSTEASAAIVPGPDLCAPAETAWTPLAINLTAFADARGRVRASALDRALTACVEIGDLLHDELPRYSSVSRHDAWFNRRLSIDIRGIGDLAAMRGNDPRSLAVLDELRSLIDGIRGRLHSLSAEVAKRRGIVPSLQQSDPTRRLPAGARHDDWCMRWRRAVDAAAVRHRNLVTMSPWSVVPAARRSQCGSIDMLPLIEAADALSFRRRIPLAHWNVSEFKRFHERARAVLAKRNASIAFARRV